MRELYARLKSRPAIFGEALAASLLANILALASPLFVIQVLNRYIAHGVDATLATLAIGTVIAVILEFSFRQVRMRLIQVVNAPYDENLAKAAFATLTGAKAAAAESLPPGIRQQIVAGADQVRGAYSAPNVAAVMDVPFALVFVFALFLLSPLLAVIAILFLAAVFVVATMTMASLRLPMREMAATGGRRNALVGSAIQAADTVRAFNASRLIRRLWENESGLFQRLHRAVTGRQGLVQSLTSGAQGLMSVTVIATGAVLVVHGQMDVGGLIGANILAARALGPLVKLAQMGESFATARQALAMLQEFLRLPRERAEGSALDGYKGGIAFQDLGFVHPGQRAPLFESMNLNIEPGATLVFAGANGAGKTTLARLIVGLIEPTRGKILVDGVDLAQVVPEWWRKQVMYLPQEPGFLNASVRDNLTALNPDLDEARLNELARVAGFKAFIDQSANGFDTPIVNNGAALALGIRRRLALGRALATDGRLMVVDDPTEGLDTDGAKLVLDAINNAAKQGRTVIVFTHDPHLLAQAQQYVDLNVKPVPRLVRKADAADKPGPKPVREVGS